MRKLTPKEQHLVRTAVLSVIFGTQNLGMPEDRRAVLVRIYDEMNSGDIFIKLMTNEANAEGRPE